MEVFKTAGVIIQGGLVISAPLQALLDKLAIHAVKEISLILGADEELKKLHRTLEGIKAMVGHVEENLTVFPGSISAGAWKAWLEDVEENCYSADELIDDILLDMSKHKATLPPDAKRDNQLRNMVFSSFKCNLPRELRRVRTGLENIAREMDMLYKTEFTKSQCTSVSKHRPTHAGKSSHTSSVVDENYVIGREKDKECIVSMLLNDQSSSSTVDVVPIVGMGGLGKTTLIQLVFRDDRVEENFDLKLWTHVTMEFDIFAILKSLLESASGKRVKLTDLDTIQVKFQSLIRAKKFLLVLDDYWSEKYGDWDVLSSSFSVGGHGSKVLVTTRKLGVSHIVGTKPSYCLQRLTDEECWELIKLRANKNLTMELENIGKKIAIKCLGLPLAAKTLGSLLHFKDDPKEWILLLSRDLKDLDRDDSDIFPTLALSYYDLPVHLKKCFAYCAMFPKGYEFVSDQLVFLWIAEGFVRPTGNMRMEELGKESFNNLLWRCFFQPFSYNKWNEKTYQMHDLVHSLAELISGRACLHLDDQKPNECDTCCKSTRHIYLMCRSQHPRVLKDCLVYENLKTLVISQHGANIVIPGDLFTKLRSLRVIDFSRMGLVMLPKTIKLLKRLRHLNLSGNNFASLPDSLTNLFGLQVLKLEHCPNLHQLPRNMKEMVSLEHLDLDINQLESMPSKFGRLVNLQSLSVCIVTRMKGCDIGELKNINLLRGCLRIKNLENVLNLKEAKDAMLDKKTFLDRLELEWGGGDVNKDNDAQVLAGLQPHENLKELLLINYSGVLFPSWLGDPLCKLSNIKLQGCRNYHNLVSLGRLPHLTSLIIEDMADWSNVDDDFSGFPSLESLMIIRIPNLTQWDSFPGSRFPYLRTLCIEDCPMLTNLPSLVDTSLLRRLNINECPQILSLPDDGLPSSLQELIIAGSDILSSRCMVEGADRCKIRSIEKIVIVRGSDGENTP